jgi:hypothetical protein
MAGHEQHRRVVVRRDLRQRQARGVGQDDVDQREIEPRLDQHLGGLATRCRASHVRAGILEDIFDESTDQRFIIDNSDMPHDAPRQRDPRTPVPCGTGR